MQAELRSAGDFVFPMTFRELPLPSGTLYFTHYLSWMGRARELVGAPLYERLQQDMQSRQGGFITNVSEAHILGCVRLKDRVRVETQVSFPADNAGDIDFAFQYVRETPGQAPVVVAVGTQRCIWFAPNEQGAPQRRPVPAYIVQHLLAAFPRVQAPPPPDLDAGAPYFTVPPGPAAGPVLSESTFEMGFDDCDIIGNVNFATYFSLQGRARDRLLQAALPDWMKHPQGGEPFCTRTKVTHLRESFPFDQLLVRMSIRSVHQRRATLYFEYFRVLPDGGRQKVAVGDHDLAWAVSEPAGTVRLLDLPSPLLRHLVR